MTTNRHSLKQVLEEAEAAVLKILSSAAVARDYAALDEARGIAEELRRIGSTLGKQPATTPAMSGQPKTRRTQRRGKKRTPTNYPRFRFEGDSLFKVGWSKKKAKEYEQRVPMARVRQIAAVLEQMASRTSDLTTVEQILESSEMAEAGAAPSYQVYIVLALLRAKGLLTASGRDGYRLSPGIEAGLETAYGQDVDAKGADGDE